MPTIQAGGATALGLAAKGWVAFKGNHEEEHLAFARSVYRIFKTPGGVSEMELRGAAAIFEQLLNLSELFNYQAFVSQAEGNWLDLHAEGAGLIRAPGETDAALRLRLTATPNCTMAGLNAALAVAVAKTGLRAALVELPLAFVSDFPNQAHDGTLLAYMAGDGGAFCASSGLTGNTAWTSPVPPGVLLRVGSDATAPQMSAGLNAVFAAKAGGVACDLWIDPAF